MKYYIFGVSENTRVFFNNLVDQRPDDFLPDGDFQGFVVDAKHLEEPKWFSDFDFVDPDKLRVIPFVKILVNPHELDRGIYLPIYDNKLRETKFKESIEMGLTPLTFIDKRALVDVDAKIGKGSWIGMGACVQTGAELGEGCILWGMAWVGHSSKIGSFSFVSTNSTICGNVILGESCYVGVNCAVKEKVQICNNTLLGMGSLITKNITEENGIYLAGVNARKNNT